MLWVVGGWVGERTCRRRRRRVKEPGERKDDLLRWVGESVGGWLDRRERGTWVGGWVGGWEDLPFSSIHRWVGGWVGGWVGELTYLRYVHSLKGF